MKLPLADQLELDTLLANLSPTSQLPYLGPHIKITKLPPGTEERSQSVPTRQGTAYTIRKGDRGDR
jgi:hypothetical protein